MSDDSALILHVGMPKGGSSALQTALSRSPDLERPGGRRLRYSSLQQVGGLRRTLQGESLRQLGLLSVYGYTSWPSIGPRDPAAAAPVLEQLNRLCQTGQEGGDLPIASNEGWISQPEIFARALANWGHPPVEVVAFLRPPVDWANAAFWQWGVWHARNMGHWLARGERYRFGIDLESWAEIPNVRLRLSGFRPDVVGKFAALYGVDLPGGGTSNSSSPPALIGFLMRNRRFRETAHDSGAEFVFQRWCPPVPGRRLWAIRWKHMYDLRETVARNRDALERIATGAEFAEICSDPRWCSEEPYHAEIEQGPSPLDDRAEMAGLYTALCAGLERASEAAGTALGGPLPGCPPEQADLERWDAVLAALMERLQQADASARRRLWTREAGTLIRNRGRGLLPWRRGGR
ncbi:hypothetical protein M4578_24030 [Salipiger sp. P9]|uniref:hypothetical protein n=1 Tax=Salipiger pentaromativorans TaxID=2943193 RepID=UPI0021579ADA|nr:hypothetical protein [Salipiger pentaromativorans]MCR8550907.1 hypothetical protein [Salipiger pentaromativorans]